MASTEGVKAERPLIFDDRVARRMPRSAAIEERVTSRWRAISTRTSSATAASRRLSRFRFTGMAKE